MRCLRLQGIVAKFDCEREGLLACCNGAVVVSSQPEYLGHPGQYPSQPGSIVERSGQGLGFARQSEAPPILTHYSQRELRCEAEVDGQHPGVAGLGQVREGLEGLLEGGHRLAERGTVVGPGTGLPAVGHGLAPHLAPHGMVRQAVDLLGHPLGHKRLESFDQTRVQHPPPLQQEAVVGYLVCQGVFEGVFLFGEQAGLIQELSGLQLRQATVQPCLRQVSNSLEQQQGYLMANHRSSLQQVLLLRRQAVHACCEYSLYCGRYLNARQRLGQPIRPALADQYSGLHQGAHALFQEEGIAGGPSDQQRLERLQTRVIPEQGLQEGVRTGRRQGVQAQLRIVRLAAPGVLVLRAIIDQEEQTRRRQTLYQTFEQGLRLGIDPVQVFKDHEHRLHLALTQEHAFERYQRALAALGRVERQEGTVVREHVEQRQQRRDGVLEDLVQGQELPSHFRPDSAGVVALVEMGVTPEQVEHGEIGCGLAVGH
jgi:hypothetical protein